MTPTSGQRWRLCRDGVVRDVNDPMTAPHHDDARTWPIEGVPDVVRVDVARPVARELVETREAPFGGRPPRGCFLDD